MRIMTRALDLIRSLENLMLSLRAAKEGKLSNGWRQSRKKRRVMVHNGISSPLLEQYNSCGKLNMIWTVDILLENSSYVQVLMVWDILPSSDIPKLTMSLDSIFQNYTVEQMNRCLYKCMEGNLVVPMRWTADSRSARQGSSSEASTGKLLKSPCLDDELSTTAKAARNLVDPMRWTADSRSARQGSSSEGDLREVVEITPVPEDELSATAKAARNLVDPMRWTADSRSARQGSSSEGSAGKLLKSPCPEDELSATAKAARYATALAGATLALSLP
ncbi:hypothetical protein OIU77_021575 [Salix suchowensis]|uniref:Uncharacterized protein n=1 Tax=Salix suchowensis TaxID=1278906 RepID=A0ABQ9CC80_9ROSI|nr:hypothetical protein OIU77_021575 [Salix suchowensis]